MTLGERKMIDKIRFLDTKDAAKTEMTKEWFKTHFNVRFDKLPSYTLELLKKAHEQKNAIDLDYALCLCERFKLCTNEFAPILCKLLESSWHYRHDTITVALLELKSPDTVEALYKTALGDNDYLSYKCIWGLGDIGTPESKEKLRLLSVSENPIIKESAIKQLETRQ
jgi:hypothetical protein